MTTDDGRDEHSRASATRFGRKFSAGQIVFEAGDPAVEAYLLQEGRIRLTQLVGGTERSLRVVKPGELFGEQALLPGTPRSYTAVALEDATTIVLDPTTFEEVVAKNPATGMRVLEELIRRLREAENQIQVLLLRDSQLRVATALIQLCEEAVPGPSAPQGPQRLTLSPLELSTRAGVDVGTVRRVVQSLRTSGYIGIRDEQVMVPDPAALREMQRLLALKEEIAGGAPTRGGGRGSA